VKFPFRGRDEAARFNIFVATSTCAMIRRMVWVSLMAIGACSGVVAALFMPPGVRRPRPPSYRRRPILRLVQ